MDQLTSLRNNLMKSSLNKLLIISTQPHVSQPALGSWRSISNHENKGHSIPHFPLLAQALAWLQLCSSVKLGHCSLMRGEGPDSKGKRQKNAEGKSMKSERCGFESRVSHLPFVWPQQSYLCFQLPLSSSVKKYLPHKVKEIMHIKYLAQCLVQCRHSMSTALLWRAGVVLSMKKREGIVFKKNIKINKTEKRNSFQFSKHMISVYQGQGCCAGWWVRKNCHHIVYNSTGKKRYKTAK